MRLYLQKIIFSGIVIILLNACGSGSSDSGNNISTTSLSDGLVAYYKFEGNANDSSGHGNDGTEYGGINYEDGVIGKAGSFDNSENKVKIKSDSLNGLNSFSINFFTKFNDSKVARHYFISGANAEEDNEFELQYNNSSNSGLIHLTFKGITYGISGTKINDNLWHHLSIIKLTSSFRLYIDGKFDSEWDVSFIDDSTITIDNNGLWIATEQDCVGGCFDSSQYLSGKIDDFRIYNRALNETEIKTLYNMGK